MKTIRVVAALIISGNTVLATQRNYGEFKGSWEFPGGKIEEGETPEQALHREITEELDIQITDLKFFDNIQYSYDSFNLDMDCFTCRIEAGEIKLIDHSQMKWLDAASIESVDWLPADISIARELKPLLIV